MHVEAPTNEPFIEASLRDQPYFTGGVVSGRTHARGDHDRACRCCPEEKNGRFAVGDEKEVRAVTAADLGTALGERATLVQFSSSFCAPCRTTRHVLAQVVDLVPGVSTVEVDAESNLALVRRLDVLSTPTVLVLDRTGKVVAQASGAPTRDQVLATLASAVDP